MALIKLVLSYILMTSLCALVFSAGAQIPALGGVDLREVTQLQRVPEPLGGLIPYRQGKLWGYADTTGKLIIKPVFAYNSIQDAVLFHDGYAVVWFPARPDAVKWLPGRPPSLSSNQSKYRMHILNARGELLRIQTHEAAVKQQDGSLEVVPRWNAHGLLEMVALEGNYKHATGFATYEYRRVRPTEDWPDGLPETARYVTLLGNNRVSWAAGKTNQIIPGGHVARSSQSLYLLANMKGEQLTDYRFSSIGLFSENRAPFARRDAETFGPRGQRLRVPPQRFGYLDTTGQASVPAQFDRASAFHRGRAVVHVGGQAGIIDLQGRYLLALSQQDLSAPDESGFVRQAIPIRGKAEETKKRYLSLPEQINFSAMSFDGAGPFRQGRAWVKQGQRVGLIDKNGIWVTLIKYNQLVTPKRLRSQPEDLEEVDLPAELEWSGDTDQPGEIEEQSYQISMVARYPKPDTAYLIAKRGRKVGLVARHSGREVVPVVYDSVVANACYGTACLRRGGRNYVVIVSSGTAIEANYQGIDFMLPRGRCMYITRTQPVAWALLDTTGRLVTSWIPGVGYPTAGWLLTHEPGKWTVRDSSGRVAYTSAARIAQPAGDERWAAVQASLQGDKTGLLDWPYWRLPLSPGTRNRGGVFFIRDSIDGSLQILDARLHTLGRVLPPQQNISAPFNLLLLHSGWFYAAPPNFPPPFRREDPPGPPTPPAAMRLFNDVGQAISQPLSNLAWAYFPSFDYNRAWRERGVLPTTKGYITRGHRRLWSE